MQEHSIKAQLDELLQHGGPRMEWTVVGRAAPFLTVQATRTSGATRPDGLRDDVETDPGFSFEVAEGLLTFHRGDHSAGQIEAVHRCLWEAGTDDWMDYSHFMQFESEHLQDGPLQLTFSSTYKGAKVISALLQALRLQGKDAVTVSRAADT